MNSATILCFYGTYPISPNARSSVARLLGQLIAKLSAAGLDVTAVCPPEAGPAVARRIPVKLDLMEKARLRMLKYFHAGNYDRVWMEKAVGRATRQGVDPEVVLCATLAAPKCIRRHFPASKIIYWIHNAPGLSHELQVLDAISFADLVIVPSYATYECLWNLYQRNHLAPPVCVISNWVDTDVFAPADEAERVARRTEFGLTPDDFAIVHIGGRAQHKGLQIVESALTMCGGLGKKIVLLSAGGSSKAERVGSSRHVELRLLGRLDVSTLRDLYTAGDLGVVPSVWFEPAPLAAMEMLACGLCVVASRAGGLPEIVEHEYTGLLVSHPNDIEAWAESLRTIIMDQPLRSRLACNGRAKALQQFDEKHCLPKWMRVLSVLRKTAFESK